MFLVNAKRYQKRSSCFVRYILHLRTLLNLLLKITIFSMNYRKTKSRLRAYVYAVKCQLHIVIAFSEIFRLQTKHHL